METKKSTIPGQEIELKIRHAVRTSMRKRMEGSNLFKMRHKKFNFGIEVSESKKSRGERPCIQKNK